MIKFKRGKKTIIITHHNADIDAICSSAALYEGFGQKGIISDIGVPNSVSKQARKILEYADVNIEINPDLDDYEIIYILDTAVPEQLQPVKIPEGKYIILIDHHEYTKIKGNQEYISPRRKATCELILKVLKDNNVKITKKIANLLLAGIISDTNHFKFADKVTFKLVVELLNYKADLPFVYSLIHNPPELQERIAKLKGVKNVEIYKFGNYIVAFSEVDNYEASVARGLLSLGADIGIAIAIKKDELRVSARASNWFIKESCINLGQDLFLKIGNIVGGSGGGHDAAGSLNTPKTEKKEEIKDLLVSLISKKLGNYEKL
ncbi:MAG: hypothetical protein B6U88_01725 [Candidatus Aenigmarchaeota archaeon ex4484_56]|nr:MAG: hypothetical protein B6U88_01725 [Candidatus Aenigmarchaeota archaeon ex4484_56]